jgi:nucleotide-binding universal stress UspA family protein
MRAYITRGEIEMEKIVVGVDGSESAQQALEWAAAEAKLRGADLIVVHTWQQPAAVLMSPYAPVLADTAALEEGAWRTLTGSVAAASLTEMAGQVQQVVVQGPAAPALIEAARDSSLLVVGSRGRGGFAGLLLGSVSQQVAHEATVPIVIIPRVARATNGNRGQAEG